MPKDSSVIYYSDCSGVSETICENPQFMAAAFDILFSWGWSNPVLPQVINCVRLENRPAFMLEMISLGQGCVDLLSQGLMKEIRFPRRKSLSARR